ncbi:MAG: alcohol dehydrogenase catalytic domain-containing protein [Sandaracinaceae bacterium]
MLALEDVEVGEPGPGEARVRHTAIGLNFIDTYHRTGLYPLERFPAGLGLEAAGVIEKRSGDGVDDLAIGQRVAYATGPVGAYTEARVLPARFLVPLPDGVSDEAAAAGLLKGMTVEYLIRRTHAVSAGETVLWHAAAGGLVSSRRSG